MRKVSCIAVVLVLSLVLILTACGGDSGKMTLEKYNKIENGMTYDQVKEIVGSDGEQLSEVGEKSSEFYTVMYSWAGSGSLGANANFTFQGNPAVLIAKAQIGLK